MSLHNTLRYFLVDAVLHMHSIRPSSSFKLQVSGPYLFYAALPRVFPRTEFCCLSFLKQQLWSRFITAVCTTLFLLDSEIHEDKKCAFSSLCLCTLANIQAYSSSLVNNYWTKMAIWRGIKGTKEASPMVTKWGSMDKLCSTGNHDGPRDFEPRIGLLSGQRLKR